MVCKVWKLNRQLTRISNLDCAQKWDQLYFGPLSWFRFSENKAVRKWLACWHLHHLSINWKLLNSRSFLFPPPVKGPQLTTEEKQGWYIPLMIVMRALHHSWASSSWAGAGQQALFAPDWAAKVEVLLWDPTPSPSLLLTSRFGSYKIDFVWPVKKKSVFKAWERGREWCRLWSKTANICVQITSWRGSAQKWNSKPPNTPQTLCKCEQNIYLHHFCLLVCSFYF